MLSVRADPYACSRRAAAATTASASILVVRDSFVIRVLKELPASYANMGQPKEPWCCPEDGIRECSDCVSDPWVILATITVPAKAPIGEKDIDNLSQRRYVASLADYWFQCSAKPATPTPVDTPGATPAVPPEPPTP